MRVGRLVEGMVSFRVEVGDEIWIEKSRMEREKRVEKMNGVR